MKNRKKLLGSGRMDKFAGASTMLKKKNWHSVRLVQILSIFVGQNNMTEKKMKSRNFFTVMTVMLMAWMTALPAQAQRSQGGHAMRERYNRSNSYGDVVDVRLHEPGTLEEKMPKDMMDRVRLLHVEGPMDYRDFKFIKRLCGRSRCVDSRDKRVDNYIDLELEHARIMSSGNGGLLGGHGNRDELGDGLSYANHLRSILLPERLKRINSDALRGCSHLEEVIMPKGVRSIGNCAFSGCSELEYISLPDGLESIGNECFYSCSNLTSITIPGSVAEIGDKAFKGTGLKRVKLPSGLMTLGAKAFDDTPLTALYLPAATQIVDDDLGSMKKLEEITVEDGNRYYTCEDGLLYDNTGRLLLLCPMARRGTLTIPADVTHIGRRAFAGSALSGIFLPASLTRLGEYAFTASRLINVVLPEGVTAIPTGAFSDCSQLTSIALPEGLAVIGESAFENCSSLRSIDLPEGVSVLLPRVFKHCKSLVHVTFPAALTGIGKEAFEGCGLTAIDLPTGLTTLGERAFKNCKGLTSVVVPDACSMVGKEAFRECTSLSAIDLGNGVTTIGDNALRETAITTLVLPESVTQIGKKVTEKCKSLTRIDCHAVLPPKLDGVSNNKVELRVLATSVNAYRSTKNWKNFKTILPLE